MKLVLQSLGQLFEGREVKHWTNNSAEVHIMQFGSKREGLRQAIEIFSVKTKEIGCTLNGSLGRRTYKQIFIQKHQKMT